MKKIPTLFERICENHKVVDITQPEQTTMEKQNIIRTIETGIVAVSTKDVYSCGMRNGMRWCKSLLDNKEPEYEDALPYAQTERRIKMIHETANIGEMDVDLITNRDTAPSVRIINNSCYNSTYLTMQEVTNLVNTLTSFLDRASREEEETPESILKKFLETNMEACNVTRSDAPALLHKLIDADIASPNEDGYYWASITDRYKASLYPICYTKDDEDGWILPVCFKSKVKWWYPKKLKTKFSEED